MTKTPRFVDDLTKVKPEEIYYTLRPEVEIQEIVKVLSPYSEHCSVLVIMKNGWVFGCTKDGEIRDFSDRCFAYKPKKVWKYKTLQMLLNECTSYYVDWDRRELTISFPDGEAYKVYSWQLINLGKHFDYTENLIVCDRTKRLIHEVEE